MGEYFKPLRRKIGVLTLVMACVFMVGWVKSRFELFGVHSLAGGAARSLASMNGRLIWCSLSPIERRGHILNWHSSPLPNPPLDLWEGYEIDSHWKWNSFEAGLGSVAGDSSIKYRALIIPYWSIAIPLTLLSAYVLLSKPRHTKVQHSSNETSR